MSIDRILFWLNFVPLQGYSSLWTVCILVFCLSHGQSAIERGFKTNKEYLVENLMEESLISLRVINDHMKSKCYTTAAIPHTKELIRSVRSARSKYEHALEQRKKEKVTSAVCAKRKLVTSDIEDVKRKKKRLKASISNLIKEADAVAVQAEEKEDIQLLIKSDDLRRLSQEKGQKVKELEHMEQKLKLKRDSIVWNNLWKKWCQKVIIPFGAAFIYSYILPIRHEFM